MSIALFAFLLLTLPSGARASEEDLGKLLRVEFTAKTTANTFGTVALEGETAESPSGPVFTSLAVQARERTLRVPRKELSRLSGLRLFSVAFSSELGYPERGIGPFLYVSFAGEDAAGPCLWRLTFEERGFKSLERRDRPAKASP